MKKMGRILIVAFVLIVIVVSIIYFRPMKLGELEPSLFADITRIEVTEWIGMVSKEYEVTSEGDIALISKYLEEIIAGRMIQLFAPEGHFTKLHECYTIHLYHGNNLNRPDVLSLNPGYVQINDIAYPVSAPRSFSLLHLIVANQNK